MRKIKYIETTLNGYIIKKVEICDWDRTKDLTGMLTFEQDGEEVEYYNDIAGNMDELDEFLKTGSNNIEGYDKAINTKENIYMEYWLTNTVGYYTDRYIGLIIE